MFSVRQFHITNGIPMAKTIATHYSEIGTNTFGNLLGLGGPNTTIEAYSRVAGICCSLRSLAGWRPLPALRNAIARRDQSPDVLRGLSFGAGSSGIFQSILQLLPGNQGWAFWLR